MFQSKYKESVPARFFLYNNPFFDKNDIWFHSCSLGETKSLKPIIERLEQNANISVITNTGYKEAKKLSNSVRYLPFEIFQPFWQKRQKVLVVLEAELWYMLFFTAKRKGDKTILLNARISDNSYKSYKKFSFFYKLIFRQIDEVFAQSQKDADRLKELGAKNIKVIGNIKTFGDFKPTKHYTKPKDRKVVLLASTHKDEERAILSHLKPKRDLCIVVAPRHPERFKEVDEYLREYCDKNEASYSALSKDESFEKDVVLCDKMGELVNIYAICDIAVLGGSFIDGVGGHNPLEPASFEIPIISGRYFFNQQTLYDSVENIHITQEDKIEELIQKDLLPARIKDRADIEPVIRSIQSVV